MEWVVQCALVGLIASANQRGTHLVSHYNPDSMGFTPMTERMPPPEVMSEKGVSWSALLANALKVGN